MLKKTLTYTDFDEVERTEDFYFNLTKPEIVLLDAELEGGLEGSFAKAAGSGDLKKMIDIFRLLLLRSYGQKSADGKRFLKSEEISKDFECSAAYPEFFMELAGKENTLTEFILGIVPKDVREQMVKQLNTK